MQALERLELPLTTYRAIKQIAQIQGVTLADAVGNLVRQFYRAENLAALRDEYQQLANKELARSITVEETASIEAVARQLSDIEMESEASRIWEEQTEKMNVLLQELKGTLKAIPDKKETVK